MSNVEIIKSVMTCRCAFGDIELEYERPWFGEGHERQGETADETVTLILNGNRRVFSTWDELLTRFAETDITVVSTASDDWGDTGYMNSENWGITPATVRENYTLHGARW